MAIVYQHRRKDNGEVFYVGIGKNEKRAYSKSSRGKFWLDYTSKYQYEVVVSHRDIIWEEACSIEKYLICFYGRRDLGLGSLVNITDGGDGLINASEFTRKKMSLAKIGKTTWNKGVAHTQETKNKISKANKGKKLPSMTEEAKAKISVGNTGKVPWNKNKKIPLSEEAKRKISASHKGKKVICPHCGKQGGISAMKYWHFDNCKSK